MKRRLTALCIISTAIIASCDLRSGTAKKELEKFSGTPTPTISPTPTATPIDPADIVQVDTAQDSKTLTVDGHMQKKTVDCKGFDRVMINGNESAVTVTGACRQIMINGNGNKIKADAASEFVFNGSENSMKYARFVNGKQPLVIENRKGNIIEKAAFEPEKSGQPGSKDDK